MFFEYINITTHKVCIKIDLSRENRCQFYSNSRLRQMKVVRARTRDPGPDSIRVRVFGAPFMYKILTIFTRTYLRRDQGCVRAQRALEYRAHNLGSGFIISNF